jgi:glutathione synthase/RimK-type ligase-like ATP-grasp enzyme
MFLQHNLLKEKSIELGYKVDEFTDSGIFGLRISKNEKSRLIFQGSIYDSMSRTSEMLIDNKSATKTYLMEIGIPIPNGITLHEEHLGSLKNLFTNHPGENWVCKPIDATEGMGVGLHIKDEDAVKKHIESHPEFSEWMVEEFVSGNDVRIQVIGGKLAAACRRDPASIFTDGKRTIKELIEERDLQTKEINPENRCILDKETETLLKHQDVLATDIPSEGKKIWIKEVANMSQGGRAIDITEELHQNYFEWAEKISIKFDMEIFSIDIISADHKLDPTEHAKVLELNARSIWIHHTFSEVKKYDIPQMIIKSLF